MSEGVDGSVGGGLEEERGHARNLGGDEDRLKSQMETQALQTAEKSLIVVLKRSELSDQTLSDLLKDRESFGLAWLMVRLCMRNNGKGNIHVEQPRRVDLSGTFGLSPKKLFFFLDFLPDSVEEIKLDSVAVKGDALPLFVRYLERAKGPAVHGESEEGNSSLLSRVIGFIGGGLFGHWQGQGQGTTESRGREGSRLKSFIFAENSLGPSEAVKVFPLLLPCLEKLCLKGNPLGTEGFQALAKCMLNGKAASLRVLDLENTRLNGSLNILCGGLQRGLGVHTLNLSENGLSDVQLGQVACVLRRGRLADLETLGLGGDFRGDPRIAPSGLSMLGEVLCGGAVPHLKNLNLMSGYEGMGLDAEKVKVVLRVLSSEKCRRGIENVQLHVQSAREEDLKALASGKFPVIRTLRLNLNALPLIAFLEGLATESRFDALDLTLCINAWAEIEELQRLTLLGDAILRGRLDLLRKLKVVREWLPLWGGVAETKRSLFSALGLRELSLFSELILENVNLNDEELILLAKAVRVGNLSRLRVLDLQKNEGIGKVGLEALMDAVVESESGLPFLEEMNLMETNAWGGAGYLGRALLSGKLGNLSVIILQSCGLTKKGLRGLVEAVREGGLVGVSYLNMGMNSNLGGMPCGQFLHAVAQSKRGLPKLKELHVFYLGEEGAVAEFIGSGKVPSLQRLEMGNGGRLKLNEEGVQILRNQVERGRFPPRLVGLTFIVDLQSAKQTEEVNGLITAIAESKKGLPSCMGSLDLSGGCITEEPLICLAFAGGFQGGGSASSGGKFSHLESLTLSGCGIDDSLLERWGEVFRAHVCPKMTLLNLSRNRISIQGISSFFDTLRPESLPALISILLCGQEGMEGKEQEDRFYTAIQKLRNQVRLQKKLLRLKHIVLNADRLVQ